MTFAINAPAHRRRPGVGRAARGFTLIELLLVIGILGLLMGLLLPAVANTYTRGKRIRTQADLQTITAALEAYKSDFGVYPPVTSANAGAAVLGKALLGPADAAHYYRPATGGAGQVADDALQNPPAVYESAKVYQAGDVVTMGTVPDFATFATGLPAPGANIWVCVRNDTTSPHTPADGSNWWTRFIPYDGNDGAGVKARLAAAADANGIPHAAAGKVYGPYLDPQRFRNNGTAILDRYDMPILYFPVNSNLRATGVTGTGVVGTTAPVAVGSANYPGETSSGFPPPIINERDNRGAFVNEASLPVEDVPAGAVLLVAKMRIMLGDYSANGIIQSTAAVPELALPTSPFLLWTAGPDKRFGPTGQANPSDYSKGDYYSTATNAMENRATAIIVDDVTNFRP